MKASIYSLLLCLIISSNTIAQNTLTTDTLSETSLKHKVLIVIDTTTTLGVDELIFNISKIDTFVILKPDSSVLLYGVKAKDGAIIIKAKGAIKFVRLNDILNKFNIKKEDRSLQVCINHSIVEDPSNILADDDEVVGVEITTEINWRYYDPGIRKEKFINIITRKGQFNRSK